MGDFTANRPFNYIAGTTIDPDENNPNENEAYNKHNGSMNATTGHMHTGATGDGPVLDGSSIDVTTIEELPPVGSIIPHYDFDGSFTPDPTVWKYCDGTNYDFGGAVGIQALPDLSNRYLVGFGTDGGGDIATADWNLPIAGNPAVGNDNHEVDLQHSHSALHQHTFNHTHEAGTLVALITLDDVGDDNTHLQDAATASWTSNRSGDTGAAVAFENFTRGTKVQGNVNGTPVPNTTSLELANTGVELSLNESIQPKSIRVRFIIRVI